MPSLRIVGPGRAGTSLARALEARRWTVAGLLGRDDDPALAADGVDVCVVATPDGAIGATAARIDPRPDTLIVHLSGALGLSVLAPHARRAVLHPLVALPDADRGSFALIGAWFGVAGDPLVGDIVAALGGRSVVVADDQRAGYHAAACVASNHLVALLAQVERIAGQAGVPVEAYLGLVRSTLDHVTALGPAAALTGPVARGDWGTVQAHLDAIGAAEAPLYLALAGAAAALAGRPLPELVGGAPCR